jgi:hypothetical protein
MAVSLTLARLRKVLADVLQNPGGTAHIWGPVSAVVALLGLVATRRLLRSTRRLRLPENETILKSVGVTLHSLDELDDGQECSIGLTRRSLVITRASEVLQVIPILEIDDVLVLTAEGSSRTRIVVTAGKSKPNPTSIAISTTVPERAIAILTRLEASRRNIQDGRFIQYRETTEDISFLIATLLQASNSQSLLCPIASDRLTSLGSDVAFWRDAVLEMLGICVEQLRRVETSPQDWPVSAVLLRPFELMPMPKPEVIAAGIKDMRQLVEKREKADEKEAMLFGTLVMLRCLAGLLDAISLQRALSDADVAWIAAQAESFDNHVVCLLFHILFVKAHSAVSFKEVLKSMLEQLQFSSKPTTAFRASYILRKHYGVVPAAGSAAASAAGPVSHRVTVESWRPLLDLFIANDEPLVSVLNEATRLVSVRTSLPINPLRSMMPPPASSSVAAPPSPGVAAPASRNTYFEMTALGNELGFGFTPSTCVNEPDASNFEYIYPKDLLVDDVIGVLFNATDSTISYYQHGELLMGGPDMQHTHKVANANDALFPTVLLGNCGQMCRFNFGLAPFRYKPSVPFVSLEDASK